MPDKEGGGGQANAGDYLNLTPSNPDYLKILASVGGYNKMPWYDSTLTGLADAVLIGGVTALTAGAGSAAGLGAIGAAAAGGATSTAVSDEVHGTPLTLGSVATGAATNAVTQGLNQAGVNPYVAGGTIGAANAALHGQNVVAGAAGGLVSTGISQGLTSNGVNPVIAGAAASLGSNYLKQNLSSNSPSMAAGSTGNGMATTDTSGSNINWNQILNSLGGLASGVGGAVSGQQNSNLQHNAYTSAINSANLTPWNVTGPGGTGAGPNVTPGGGSFNGFGALAGSGGNFFGGSSPPNGGGSPSYYNPGNNPYSGYLPQQPEGQQSPSSFMQSHPEVSNFLQSHPGVAQALGNPSSITPQMIQNFAKNDPQAMQYLQNTPGAMNALNQQLNGTGGQGADSAYLPQQQSGGPGAGGNGLAGLTPSQMGGMLTPQQIAAYQKNGGTPGAGASTGANPGGEIMARANGYGAGTPGGGQGYSNYNSPVNGAGGNAPITNGKNGNTFGINAGALGTTLGGYNAFTNQQLGMAGQAGSGVPGYLSNAFGAASGASNANLGGFNNLAGSAINNANNLINSAGGNFNSAYNTSLNSQLQALNPAIQQQSNALLNSQFERGQAGTSGGALQTQALQNSFNQATLQAQNNALGQANSIMGTTYNAANTSAGIGQNAGAYGINATNNNLNNMFRYATAPATIASPYLANANQSTAGYGATNNDVNANANMSLNLMKLQADAAGNAARTAGGIATAPNFQTSGASTWGNLGNSLFGNSNSSGNYGGTLGNIFNKLFGNSNNSNDSNLNDISNGTGSYTPTNNGPMSDSTINSMIDGNSSLFSSPTAFDPSQNGIDPNAGWSA